MKRRKRYRKAVPVDYSKFGTMKKIEEFGEADDADTVYVMTPCANDTKVLECILGSLLKKLIMLGVKWTPSSWTEEIVWNPGAGSIDPSGLAINLYGGRPDTTDGSYDVIKSYALVNGDNLLGLIAQFINEFIAYSNGTLLGNVNTDIYSFFLLHLLCSHFTCKQSSNSAFP